MADASAAWYRFARGLLWLIVHCFFRLRVTGRHHVPVAGPLLVAANHLSPADPALLGLALPRRLDFLAAAELAHVPVWGWLMRRFRPIPIHRSRLDPAAAREVVRRLRAGAAVVIFPEGRIRLDEGSILGSAPVVKEGAAVVAALGSAPILPVILQDTRHVLHGRQWLRRPVISVTIGPPFCLWTPAELPGPARRDQLRLTLTSQLLATIPPDRRPMKPVAAARGFAKVAPCAPAPYRPCLRVPPARCCLVSCSWRPPPPTPRRRGQA